MKFFVKINFETIEIEADVNSTVLELKLKVEEMISIHFGDFYLKFKEKHLIEGTLKENNIEEEETIVVYFFETKGEKPL